MPDVNPLWNDKTTVSSIEEAVSILAGLSGVEIKEISDAALTGIATGNSLLKRAKEKLQIGVVGETRAGKSSLINAIIEKDLVPVDIEETTASFNRISKGNSETAEIVFVDGRLFSSKALEIAELLLARRDDLQWLAQIEYVQFYSSNPILDRCDLWDVPGIGGSSFQEKAGNRFLESADALLWVFNGTSLGKANLLSGLRLLAERGKQTVGVLNQMDEFLLSDHKAAVLEIETHYKAVPFRALCCVSATLIRRYSEGSNCIEKRFANTPFEDGGKGVLLSELYSLLDEGPALKKSALIGDLRTSLMSFVSTVQYVELQIGDRIRRHNEEILRFSKNLDSVLATFSSELLVGVTSSISAALKHGMEKRLAAADTRLLSDRHWLLEQLRQEANEDSLRKVMTEYLERRQGDLLSELKKLSEVQFTSTLTTRETDEGAALEFHSLTLRNDCNRIVEGFWRSFRTPFVASVIVLLVAGLPAAISVFLFALVAEGISEFVRGEATNTEKTTLLQQRIAEVYRTIEEALKVKAPELKRLLDDRLDQLRAAVKASANRRLDDVLLGGNTIQTSSKQLSTGVKGKMRAEELATRLSPDTCAPEGTLHWVQQRFSVGDLNSRHAVLRSILAEAKAYGSISILDGKFDRESILLLKMIDPHIPIRIVAWEISDSKNGLSEFSEALVELRNERRAFCSSPGPVEVVIAVWVEKGSTDIRPDGFWIFTGLKAYHFNKSINDLLSGSTEVTLSPEPLTVAYDHSFGRWWENKVAGYRTTPLQQEGSETLLPLFARTAGSSDLSSIMPTVAGMDDLKKELHERIIKPFRDPSSYARYNLPLPNGILLFGPPGCGKTHIALALGSELGIRVKVCFASALTGSYIHETVANIRKEFDAAAKAAPTMLFLDECDSLLQSRNSHSMDAHRREEVGEFLNQLNDCGKRGILVVAATNHPGEIDSAITRPGRLDALIYVGLPDQNARIALLNNFLPSARDPELTIAKAAELLDRYTPAEIREIVYLAAREAMSLSADVTMSLLEKARKSVKPMVTKSLESKYMQIETRGQPQPNEKADSDDKTEKGFARLAGMENLKSVLNEQVVSIVKNPSWAKEEGLELPNGILLYGPPGCGKTYMVNALAEELGFELVPAVMSDVGGIFAHETAIKLGSLFDEAERKAPALIFFDECESFMVSRSRLASHDTGSREIVGILLQRMNRCGERNILVVAATNAASVLDDAILRPGRIDRRIYVGGPDLPARISLFKSFAVRYKLNADVNFQMLGEATEGYSIADIESVMKKANASRNNAKASAIQMSMLSEAIGTTPPSVGKDVEAKYKTILESY